MRKGGTPVKKEYLSYILMVDKDVGFVFSSSFNPAPRHTVYEDGSDIGTVMSGRKRKSEQQDSMLEMGNNICRTITTTFGKMSDNVLRMNKVLAVTSEHEETEFEI